MALGRDLVGEVRRMDEADLRRLLILARGLLIDSEQPVVEVDDVPGMPSVQYRQKLKRCNKPTCGTCPHGPYWYAHWHEDGRKQSQYIGTELPADVRRKLDELDREADQRRAAAVGDDGASESASAPPVLRLVR